MQWIDAISPGPKYAECGTTCTPNASATVMTRRISVTPLSGPAADLRAPGRALRKAPALEAAGNSPAGAVFLRGGGGNPAASAPLGEPRQVLGRPHRLLEPVRIERRKAPRHLDRLRH